MESGHEGKGSHDSQRSGYHDWDAKFGESVAERGVGEGCAGTGEGIMPGFRPRESLLVFERYARRCNLPEPGDAVSKVKRPK